MWGNPGRSRANQAWTQNREGLVRASIEGKDLVTKEIVTLAQCDGHNFRTFQYIAVARAPALITGTIQPMTQLVGMKILTTDYELIVLDTGETGKAKLKDSERNLNFATYGK